MRAFSTKFLFHLVEILYDSIELARMNEMVSIQHGSAKVHFAFNLAPVYGADRSGGWDNKNQSNPAELNSGQKRRKMKVRRLEPH